MKVKQTNPTNKPTGQLERKQAKDTRVRQERYLERFTTSTFEHSKVGQTSGTSKDFQTGRNSALNLSLPEPPSVMQLQRFFGTVGHKPPFQGSVCLLDAPRECGLLPRLLASCSCVGMEVVLVWVDNCC